MGVEAHVPGRDHHKRLSLCTSNHVEGQLESQGSASLGPGPEENALSNREIFISWEQNWLHTNPVPRTARERQREMDT